MSRALRIVSRVSSMSRTLAVRGGDHHGPALPPFARLAPPSAKLPEEIELVWDDSVAPETCLDMEAPHVSTKQMWASVLFVAGCFAALVTGISLIDPEKNSPVAKRRNVIPFDGMKKELGLLDEADKH